MYMTPYYAQLRLHVPSGNYVTLWFRLLAPNILEAAAGLELLAQGYRMGANGGMSVEIITQFEPSVPASQIYKTATSLAEELNKYFTERQSK